jgi:hypothetical protein
MLSIRLMVAKKKSYFICRLSRGQGERGDPKERLFFLGMATLVGHNGSIAQNDLKWVYSI